MTVRLPTWCPECGSAAPTVRYNRPCENAYHDVVVGGPLNGTSAVTAGDRRVATGLRRTYITCREYWVEERRKTDG